MGNRASRALLAAAVLIGSVACEASAAPSMVGDTAPVPTTAPASTEPPGGPIVDWGYPELRQLADVNGDGVPDFCRFVGDDPAVFLSCQLGLAGGDFAADPYGFNSVEGIDRGYPDKVRNIVDVNEDGRADFCRYVGDAPNVVRQCVLAKEAGFGPEYEDTETGVGVVPAIPNKPALPDDMLGDQAVPLVLVLWQHPDFGGKKRVFVSDEPSLNHGWTADPFCISYGDGFQGHPTYTQCFPGRCGTGADFNDTASAVGVHPGPGFDAFVAREGRQPTVTLWDDWTYTGRPLTLQAGAYADLSDFGMSDVISSVRFNDSIEPSVPASATPAHRIAPIGTVLRVHTASLERAKGCQEGDTVITIVESTSNIGADYGSQFNDSISAVESLPGPDFDTGRSMVSLHADYRFNGVQSDWLTPQSGSLTGHSLNDKISSLEFKP